MRIIKTFMILLVITLFAVSCGSDSKKDNGTKKGKGTENAATETPKQEAESPEQWVLSEEEKALRRALGIPNDPEPQYILILSTTSHKDWDWIATFDDYYNSGSEPPRDFPQSAVKDILSTANSYLYDNKDNTPPSYYQTCEIGFLQKFAVDQPTTFNQLIQMGDRLRIVGGGITSPDNLLPTGESLLRNYLVANTWIMQTFPANPTTGLPAMPPLRQTWIPDDFGHDSQFPILMQAMGLQGTGFSRIPGDPTQYGTGSLSGGNEMAASQLVNGEYENGNYIPNTKGVDFIWKAADGSSTIAHFMQDGYCQGNDISGDDAVNNITTAFNTNKGASTTGYVYIPVSCDFQLPHTDLLQSVAAWNADNYPGNNAYAVAATFDHYVQLVNTHRESFLTRSYPHEGDATLPFQSTPYWTGFYGSRPELKRLQFEAASALLGAEIFDLLAGKATSENPALIETGWNQLAPSTHHDYITGTSPNGGPSYDPDKYDMVYTDEQLPLLKKALESGKLALDIALTALAKHVGTNPGENQLPVVIFNQLGFARDGLVEMKAVQGFNPLSVMSDSTTVLGPVQVSADGTWLFVIPESSAIPPLGYSTFYLSSTATAQPPEGFQCLPAQEPQGGYTTISLQSKSLTATITADAGWGLSKLTQFTDTNSLLSASANNLVFYNDQGSPYQFGNERGVDFNDTKAVFKASGVDIIEQGPVRLRVRVEGNYTVNGNDQTTTREYMLVAGEPLLRLMTETATPENTSVFVTFPLAKNMDGMTHGTPYHWDTKPATPTVNNSMGWSSPVFEATHDFVIGTAGGTPLGGIYHSAMRAWSTNAGKELMGCLMRNVLFRSTEPGIDPDTHTLNYAFRVPSGITDLRDGAQLAESQSFQTPLMTKIAGSGGTMPVTRSLASVTASPNGGGTQTRAFITAMKYGTVPGQTVTEQVIRIYQPSNSSQNITITLATPIEGRQWIARGITALETVLDRETALKLNVQAVNGKQVTFTAHYALTTIAVKQVSAAAK
ncbi:MAG: hypothetical protein GY940_09810 [bacterium]|nr:hypothetical protein [bacterium]